MEDQYEDIKPNVDQFMDSYARDTTVEELTEVHRRRFHSPCNPLIVLADSRANAENRGANTETPGSSFNAEDRDPYSRQGPLRLHSALWMALPRSDILLPLKFPSQRRRGQRFRFIKLYDGRYPSNDRTQYGTVWRSRYRLFPESPWCHPCPCQYGKGFLGGDQLVEKVFGGGFAEEDTSYCEFGLGGGELEAWDTVG